MDAKALLRQYEATPGVAFVAIIADSPQPSTLATIRGLLLEAGATKADVDVKWKSAQPFLAEHPHIRRSNPRTYIWSDQAVDARVALQALAKERKKAIPDWLRQALAAAVDGELPSASDQARDDVQPSQRRLFDDAKVVADFLMHVEELVHEGGDADSILNWMRAQATSHSLELLGRPGETLGFDPRIHIAAIGHPASESKVSVIRPGARWLANDVPVLVARAIVRADY